MSQKKAQFQIRGNEFMGGCKSGLRGARGMGEGPWGVEYLEI